MAVLSAVGLRRRFQPLSLTLLAGLAAALLAWRFVQLGSEMAEGETRGFDMAILRAMQELRDTPPWVATVTRDLSRFGSTAVLTFARSSPVVTAAVVLNACMSTPSNMSGGGSPAQLKQSPA